MQVIKIEIVSLEVHTFSGKRKSDGQPFEIKRQDAYLHNGHHYPERFDVELPRRADGSYGSAYAPGFYTICPSSIRVNGEYKRLELNPFGLKLLALPAEAAQIAKPAKAA